MFERGVRQRISAHALPDAAGADRRLMATPLPEAKVFCIGFSKTGTTSLAAFFKALGFTLGDEQAGTLLLHDWALRRFDPIVALARSAQVFQNVPFSLPFTFVALDKEFPGAKFILSVRRNADEWYGSLIRYFTNMIGKNRVPTADDLKEFPHPYKGWMFEAAMLIAATSEHDLFEQSKWMRFYEDHNTAVWEYFRHRPQSLLTVDLADGNAAERITSFLGMRYDGQTMPHLNRTQ